MLNMSGMPVERSPGLSSSVLIEANSVRREMMTSSLHSCWALSRDSNQMCSLQGTPGDISEMEQGNVFEVYVQLEPEATCC